ncbi:hypothetical protein JXB11_03300, partial [Candidatus Woesearchaeota archaeon]|nr:hypothetical protein [Candidatus Woesearchaeota archaeon]
FLGYVLSDEALLGEPALENFFHFKILGYRQQQGTENIIGPYGLGATLLSFLIVLGVGVGIGLYFKLRSSNVIKIRENVKTLETEFASALFQLGNRLGDGLPLEIAFSRVAEVTKETPTGKFFAQVDNNIRNRGVSVDEALFNKQFGAITLFPSNVIESSMKVLLESSKKGPKVASVAMMNVSEYIKDIHRVDERLRDLLAEIISDMKQQIKVLAPAIAGIVVGITAMIVSILGKLTDQMATIAASSGAGASVPTGLMNIFGDGVPTYFFQTIVGIYIVEIIYVMTVMVNGVENGADKLAERYQLGDNLTKSTIIYSIIAIIVTVMFTVIATSVMNTVTTT